MRPRTPSCQWLVAVAGSVFISAAPPLSPAAAQETPSSMPASAPSFVENFDALDTSFWYVSDGWVNGDHQNCTWLADQIRVENGVLRVGFEEQANDLRAYACGEVQTEQRYGYGTYEVRLRTPAGPGLNANMFTFIGPPQGVPDHDEIDFEFLLKNTSEVQLNSYVSGVGGNEYFAPLAINADADFVDYQLVWEPERLTWYADGAELHVIDDPQKVPSHPSKIYMSLWGTDTLGDWMGEFVPPEGPIAMEVDRVTFTAAGDACQFAGSLVCQLNGTTPAR